MKEKFEDLKIDDLTSSHAIENMFALLASLYFISFAVVHFFPRYGGIINAIVGASALIVAIVSFVYTYSLYGYKSKEGLAWLVLTMAIFLVLGSNIASAMGKDFLYFLFRFLAVPIITAGFLLKLWFTGLDLDMSQKTVAAMTIVGWTLLAFVSSILPAAEGGFDYTKDSYAIFALVDIFAVGVAILVIQSIKAKGWYILSVGLLLISMGDIFHPLAQDYGLIYPGTPVRLLWYLGLLVAGYGAYFQRKEHLKMIAL